MILTSKLSVIMMNYLPRTKIILLTSVFLIIFGLIHGSAQNGYQFEEIKRLPATSVKDQGKTGTCWTFSTLSLIESELLRKGKDPYNLSEMFIVRQSYLDRAELFVRFHGHLNFGPGAQAWDVMNVLEEYGIVPQNVFPGLKINDEMHAHGEMDRVLKGYMESVIQTEGDKLSPVWHQGFEGVLDAYLGKYPKNFNVDGKTYTPASFLEKIEIDPQNYIPITSFKSHEYYSDYVFESPDNWSMESIYNVPLNKLIQVINKAIMKGYTVAWAADVTNPGFSHSGGLAVVPEKSWDDMDKAEKQQVFQSPVEQKKITEEMRLEAFNSYGSTDDHLMHIVGKAKDQKGTEYFIVKNSWGTSNPYDGYLYVSEAYVKYRTTSIMLNKNSLNEDLKNKLKL
jgi:bleomycin hydrolase